MTRAVMTISVCNQSSMSTQCAQYDCTDTVVFRRVNQLSVSPSHPGQLNLLPSAGREMSRPTSQSAMTLYGWGVKAGMVHSTCGQTCEWQAKLCDPSL